MRPDAGCRRGRPGARPEDAGNGSSACGGTNIGLCNTCSARVPARFLSRRGRIFLRKECPDCGPTESLVSGDADAWQAKRDLWQYVPSERVACTLHCDRCLAPHHPSIIFIDVTNRCNMNCPICIASIRSMGFEYHPPLAYFEKIFAEVAAFDPMPMLELFGGEPTLRDDLVEIVRMARRHGLKARVVTNGLRLADEAYCRRLCEARVGFRLAFDGRSPEIYRRLRHNPAAYEKKLKAIDNLARHSRRKHALIACVARGVNDAYVGDLINLCHERRNILGELGLIPLTENWEEGGFEKVPRTTIEDVERIVRQSVPDGRVEFVPAGFLYGFRAARAFFRKTSASDTLMLGGVHPNCESITLLVSNGERYRSVNHYLRMPLSRCASEILDRTRRIERPLARLDPRRRRQRLRGQWLILKTYVPFILKVLDAKRYCKGHPVAVAARMALGLLAGKRARDLAHRYLNVHQILRVAVLPFEEYHSIDGARLEHCKVAFAYEDTDDGRIKTIPGCTWYLYRNPILKKVAARYGRAPTPQGPSPASPTRTDEP